MEPLRNIINLYAISKKNVPDGSNENHWDLIKEMVLACSKKEIFD